MVALKPFSLSKLPSSSSLSSMSSSLLSSCSTIATASLDVSGTACFLKSLLRLDPAGKNSLFGISLTSPGTGKTFLGSGIVSLFSVGGVACSRLGRPSWNGFCKTRKARDVSLAAAREEFPPKNEVAQKPEDSTVNHASRQKASAPPKVAFFDVDGTITRTNVVLAYFTHRITELPFLVKLVWVPWFALTCIFYLIVDSINRAVFNRIFYLSYKGRSVQCKTEMADFIYRHYYRPRIFAGAVELIQNLKQEGYRIVFVTGCLDFLIAPLAHDLGADYVYAAELVEENGRFTGKLKGMAASNAEKADRVQEYARKHGISLRDSLAFGDSVADIPMLEVVGHPHVVNPDARLQALADKRGWPIIRWVLGPRTASAIAV